MKAIENGHAEDLPLMRRLKSTLRLKNGICSCVTRQDLLPEVIWSLLFVGV